MISEHRLSAEKALKIISSAEHELRFPDLEIEVEYQSETIGRYGLNKIIVFISSLETDCLAKEVWNPETETIEAVSSVAIRNLVVANLFENFVVSKERKIFFFDL